MYYGPQQMFISYFVRQNNNRSTIIYVEYVLNVITVYNKLAVANRLRRAIIIDDKQQPINLIIATEQASNFVLEYLITHTSHQKSLQY